MEVTCSSVTSVTFNGLHGIISQKTKLCLTTVVRTSDPMDCSVSWIKARTEQVPPLVVDANFTYMTVRISAGKLWLMSLWFASASFSKLLNAKLFLISVHSDWHCNMAEVRTNKAKLICHHELPWNNIKVKAGRCTPRSAVLFQMHLLHTDISLNLLFS
jgi:hypothetical protein